MMDKQDEVTAGTPHPFNQSLTSDPDLCVEWFSDNTVCGEMRLAAIHQVTATAPQEEPQYCPECDHPLTELGTDGLCKHQWAGEPIWYCGHRCEPFTAPQLGLFAVFYDGETQPVAAFVLEQDAERYAKEYSGGESSWEIKRVHVAPDEPATAPPVTAEQVYEHHAIERVIETTLEEFRIKDADCIASHFDLDRFIVALTARLAALRSTPRAAAAQGEPPMCPVHAKFYTNHELVIYSHNCLACALHQREELLKMLEPFLIREGEDALSVLERIVTMNDRNYKANFEAGQRSTRSTPPDQTEEWARSVLGPKAYADGLNRAADIVRAKADGLRIGAEEGEGPAWAEEIELLNSLSLSLRMAASKAIRPTVHAAAAAPDEVDAEQLAKSIIERMRNAEWLEDYADDAYMANAIKPLIVSTLLSTIEAKDGEIERLHKSSYPHMCRDEHHQIGFADPEDRYSELCPLCETRNAVEALKARIGEERRKVLEEAAKIAENYDLHPPDEGCALYLNCHEVIAAAIRAASKD